MHECKTKIRIHIVEAVLQMEKYKEKQEKTPPQYGCVSNESLIENLHKKAQKTSIWT